MTATPHEVEVSWQALRQIVREWAGTSAELAEVTPLAGGSISTTLRLRTNDNQQAVLKITQHRIDNSYAEENHQLQLLRDVGVPVPQVYACKIGTLENPFSYLLLEFVDGIDLAEAKSRCTAEEFDQIQSHLAQLVLAIHERRRAHYMRVSRQESKTFERWDECFREVYGGIWHDVEKSGVLAAKPCRLMGRIHERLDRLLANADCPRLVHWDLWSSNILANRGPDGRWRVAALLDPMCKYAHAEAEIAYLELFHTVTPAFLKAYQHVHKLPPEYHRISKLVYHLYSLLDHLHLFGQEYLKPVVAMIEKVGELM